MTSVDKKRQASSVLKFYTIYFKKKKKKEKKNFSIMAALCIAILSTQLQINSEHNPWLLVITFLFGPASYVISHTLPMSFPFLR